MPVSKRSESPVARIGSENRAASPLRENTGFCGGRAIEGRSAANDALVVATRAAVGGGQPALALVDDTAGASSPPG